MRCNVEGNIGRSRYRQEWLVRGAMYETGPERSKAREKVMMEI